MDMDKLTNGTDGRAAALIVNTRSRSGERVFFRALDRLQELGVTLGPTYAVRDPARLPETVRDALDDGSEYRVLILGGGDGSVSSVVDFLAHRDVILGLLPLGTANDFARTLEIPVDIEEACRTIVHGKVVDVDLGMARDNYYVNVASTGLSVKITQALSPQLKKRIGALAYPTAAIRAFLEHEPFSAQLTFPDGEVEEYGRLLHLAVGNGRFYGGGRIVAPEAGIDDCRLDVLAIELGRPRSLLGVARYVKSGDFIRMEGVHHHKTERVRLETEPQLPINIDGEVVTSTPQDFTVAHNALKVIVPRESTAARQDVAV
jgi:diacylglycerol kinase (ATP)